MNLNIPCMQALTSLGMLSLCVSYDLFGSNCQAGALSDMLQTLPGFKYVKLIYSVENMFIKNSRHFISGKAVNFQRIKNLKF